MKKYTEEDNPAIEPPLEEEYETETLDLEPTMHIRELMEDWKTINYISKNNNNSNKNSNNGGLSPNGVKKTETKHTKRTTYKQSYNIFYYIYSINCHLT